VIAALLGVMLSAGCRGDAAPVSDFQFDLSVSPTPPATGPARLTLTVTDSAGASVPGLQVSVEGTMTHPGMNPSLADAEERPDGRYVVEAFDFSMAGEWVLIVRARHPDGRIGEREFPLRAVAPFTPGS
jgi:hypothetical protein